MDANSIAIGRERVSDRSEIIDPHRVAVRYITQQLGETAKHARGMIWRIVHECGAEQALEWLREAQEIESHGGMMTEDGERRRTPGGVFFKLVRDKLGGSGALGDARAMERYRFRDAPLARARPPWVRGRRSSAPTSASASADPLGGARRALARAGG
jgi:hypothetical protein